MSEGGRAALPTTTVETAYSSLDAPEGFWRTQGSTLLLMREMTTSHLHSAMSWLVSHFLEGHPKYRELMAEHQGRLTR